MTFKVEKWQTIWLLRTHYVFKFGFYTIGSQCMFWPFIALQRHGSYESHSSRARRFMVTPMRHERMGLVKLLLFIKLTRLLTLRFNSAT